MVLSIYKPKNVHIKPKHIKPAVKSNLKNE